VEELVKRLYAELYLSVDEISRITKLTHHCVYSMLWRFKIIRTPAESRAVRKQLRQLSKEQKAEYIHKARELGITYKIIAEVLNTDQKGVKRLEAYISNHT
jgi:transposase